MKFTKQEYADLHLLYGETRGNSRPARLPYGERFSEGVLSSRCTFMELNPDIYVYVRLVLIRSNTMGSPIFDLTPLDFNFWSHTKDFV
jgi:hypothetical protein